jgi:putative protease
VDGQAAAPLSALNALRRDALGQLELLRADRYPCRHASFAVEPQEIKHKPIVPALSLYLYQWREDLAEILPLADRVYLPFLAMAGGSINLADQPKELMAWLPPATHGNYDALIKRRIHDTKNWGVEGVLAGNPAHLKLFAETGLPLYADTSFNAYNGWTVAELAELGVAGITLSLELTMEQTEALPGFAVALEAAVYGRQRLMTSAYCPVGTEHGREGGKPCGACSHGGPFTIIDRMGARFPVICNPIDCRSDILNADKLALPGLAARLGKAGITMLRLSIYDEPPEEVARVIGQFRQAIAGEWVDNLSGSGYTKGHYFRKTM